MKNKKNAFANSSTGYGRGKHNCNHNYNNNSSSSSSTNNNRGNKSNEKDAKDVKDDKNKIALLETNDKDLNSGFGDYLRSPEAVEMMKLFVFANTIMLILTMAWPNLKEQYYWLIHWWNSIQTEYSE